MNNKSKKISSEISAGELLDKMSILEIKMDKIKDADGLNEVNKEYSILKQVRDSHIEFSEEIKKLYADIKKINLKLWNIEDEIRICDKKKDFGDNFINLARNVYLNNDKRSKIKSEINKLLSSNIKEIKQYADY